MNNQNSENSNIDWEDIILKLQTFTRSFVNKKGWFRVSSVCKRDNREEGFKIESTYLKGKEIDDYVYEAIEKYLRYPEKHDPLKGSLIDYLNYNIIRTLVNNDLVSSENRTTKDILAYTDQFEDDENDLDSYIDKIYPYTEAYFDQEIDYKEVMSYAESEVKGEKITEDIFLGICCFGLKRREVIEEFKMSEKDFDNGMKRLKTILNNVAKKYDLKTSLL